MHATAAKSNAPISTCKSSCYRSRKNSRRQLTPLATAATSLAVPIHPATLLRWIKDGLKGRRLPAERIGGRWFVDPADLNAFIDACNG